MRWESVNLLLDIKLPNKHPTQKAAIKIFKHNFFWVKNIIFFSRTKFLFKYVGYGLPKNTIPIGTVSLRSLPLRLEQFVITIFPPTPHGDQMSKETEIVAKDSKPSANYLRLPMEIGRVPQPSVVREAILIWLRDVTLWLTN